GRNCAEPNLASAQGSYADPVNSATGNFGESFQDFTIPGRGTGLSLDHSYNSLQAWPNPPVDGPLGYGWTHAYAMSLVDTGGVVTVTQESGAQISFYQGSGGYEAPPRVVASLTKNANGYTMVRCDGLTLAFSLAGSLTSITDRNGYA